MYDNRGADIRVFVANPADFVINTSMRPFLLCLLCLLMVCDGVFAYESDQYLNRTEDVSDSLGAMDAEVNAAIDRILAGRNPPVTQRRFARAVYYEIGGWYWADKIERWAARSPSVERYSQTRRRSIYRGMPVWATRVTFFFGVGRTFRVNNVMVGSDKLGHFFSQGYKYFRRELKDMPRERLLARGAFAERWLFGQLTTGIFSNADLVANDEGWRFYQSLFRDDPATGRQSILVMRGGRYVRQRPFTWADHINPYWDEALNPSFNVEALNRRLRQSIRKLCPEYHANPRHYTLDNDSELWEKYKDLGLKDNRRNRFDVICKV